MGRGRREGGSRGAAARVGRAATRVRVGRARKGERRGRMSVGAAGGRGGGDPVVRDFEVGARAGALALAGGGGGAVVIVRAGAAERRAWPVWMRRPSWSTCRA